MSDYFTGLRLDAPTQAALLRLIRTSSWLPPVAVGGLMSAQNSVQSAVGTSRVPFYLSVSATDIRLLFVNWYQDASFNDVDNTVALTLNVSVEIDGVIYRVNFGGRTTVTIDPGGWALSDPLPLDLPAGKLIYVRTFSSGAQWYPNRYAQYAGGGGFTVTTDLTAPGSAAIADNTTLTKLVAPSAIFGNPTGAVDPPSVLIVGDSIAYGQGDGVAPGVGINTNTLALGGGGYIVRALNGKAGVVNIAVQGDSASNFLNLAAHVKKMAFSNSCTTAIVEYGRNDVTGVGVLSTIQANLVSLWTSLAVSRNMRVFQTTITPKTATTDGFLTPGGQTPQSNETVRVALNNWLRDGAPLRAGDLLPLDKQTIPALRAGDPGHPLYGIFEAADIVETSRNSGLWKPPINVRSVTDAAMTTGTTAITSATANFTNADIGRTIQIAGAGSAGALLLATIKTITSSSAITVGSAASTTVSGVNASVYDAFTQDGTHPQSYACTLLQNCIDTTKLV